MAKKYILHEYDGNLENILYEGDFIPNKRTGIGTKALFGLNTYVDVSERFPILTKRKVSWKSMIKEVLWYISGSHNIKDLEAMGCKVWSPWKNDKFTKLNGLPEGSGGYIYAHNLIHFGADIGKVEAFKDYGCKIGFNQLDSVINKLKADPYDRQALFTFFRPDTNHLAVLPACHCMYHFIARPSDDPDKPFLDCCMFQRSNDFMVGVSWGNIPTMGIFTYIIAHATGMKPGALHHTGSHCHIYENQYDAVEKYLTRGDTPDSPILNVEYKDSVYDYTIDDFELIDYNPLSPIKVPIAV